MKPNYAHLEAASFFRHKCPSLTCPAIRSTIRIAFHFTPGQDNDVIHEPFCGPPLARTLVRRSMQKLTARPRSSHSSRPSWRTLTWCCRAGCTCSSCSCGWPGEHSTCSLVLLLPLTRCKESVVAFSTKVASMFTLVFYGMHQLVTAESLIVQGDIPGTTSKEQRSTCWSNTSRGSVPELRYHPLYTWRPSN